VLGAYERGLEVWVVDDATASDDPVARGDHAALLQQRAAQFVSVHEALTRLGFGDRPRPPGIRERDGRARRGRGPGRAARVVFPSVEERLAVLERLAEALEPEAAPLAETMAAEIGKPVRYGSLEVLRTADMLRAIARRAREPAGEPGDAAELHDRPLGVVAVITPWNNPVYIPLGKIAAALAYGNAVVWKPAPAANAIAERITSLLASAGLRGGRARARRRWRKPPGRPR